MEPVVEIEIGNSVASHGPGTDSIPQRDHNIDRARENVGVDRRERAIKEIDEVLLGHWASTRSKSTTSNNSSVDIIIVEADLLRIRYGNTKLAAYAVFKAADAKAGRGSYAASVMPKLALGSRSNSGKTGRD